MLQVGVYLPLYDYCMGRLGAPLGMYAPLVAGTIARLVAVMGSAPLELMRTRMQVTPPFSIEMSFFRNILACELPCVAQPVSFSLQGLRVMYLMDSMGILACL